jgi:hypothetical protein
LNPKEVITQANELLKVARGLDPDFVWKVAWVGLSLNPGFIDGLVAKIRAKKIGNPEEYCKSAVRQTCQERGRSWFELWDAVPPAPSRSKKEDQVAS